MTKTITTIVAHRLASISLQVIMLLDRTVVGSFVWNFEFSLLGFV
jgi:hypothetical protein